MPPERRGAAASPGKQQLPPAVGDAWPARLLAGRLTQLCPLPACLLQEFGAHELVDGVYASESTLHSSVAFLRNTLAGGRGGR